MRQSCDNWCNPRNAGAGIPSTADTANKTMVDAYFWLKTPGESDGCSQELPSGSQCPRFDASCGSVDSLGSKSHEPRAPEAGGWFDFQVKQLARHANFAAMDEESVRVLSDSSKEANASTCGINTPPPPKVAANGCALAYQQCGGKGWTGPECCDHGCTCKRNGDYYAQCTPPSTVTNGFCSLHPPRPVPAPPHGVSAVPSPSHGVSVVPSPTSGKLSLKQSAPSSHSEGSTVVRSSGSDHSPAHAPDEQGGLLLDLDDMMHHVVGGLVGWMHLPHPRRLRSWTWEASDHS